MVSEQSPIKSFADFNKTVQADPGKFSHAGSGQKSANHAAHERFNAAFDVKTIHALFESTPPLTRLYTECIQRLQLGWVKSKAGSLVTARGLVNLSHCSQVKSYS